MKKITKRLLMPAALLLGLSPFVKGQTYFQKFIHNGSVYPPSLGAQHTTSAAGLQLTKSTRGIVNVSTTDGVMIFNSMFSNGSYPSSSAKSKIAFLHPIDPIPSNVPTDLVEVDPKRGIMAITGIFTASGNTDIFVTLIDAWGQVYLTETYGLTTTEEVPNAICVDPQNKNHLYLTGYSRDNVGNKKILAMKLEYRFDQTTLKASLTPIWNGEYNMGTGNPVIEDFTVTNETGRDIYCDHWLPGNPRIYIAGSADINGQQRGFVMELTEKGDVVPAAPAAASLNLELSHDFSSFSKISGTRDGWVYFAGDCAIRGQLPMVGVYHPYNLPTSLYGWDVVPYMKRPFGENYTLRSMLVSEQDHVYLFVDDDLTGLRDASLLAIKKSDLSNPLLLHYATNIHFSDRQRDTTDNWIASDITEDVDGEYITLHSTYNQQLAARSVEIDNIYHNGERGELCGDLRHLSFESGQLHGIPRNFIRNNVKLDSLKVTEAIHPYWSTHLCASFSDPDGDYLKMLENNQENTRVENETDLHYYPSLLDATHTVTVELPGNIYNTVGMAIGCYDGTGRKIEMQTRKKGENSIEIILSSSTAPGMYFIRIQNEQKSHVLKVIRN